MAANDGGLPPILAQKHNPQPSAFTSENLPRKACWLKRTMPSSMPDVCILDPDSDFKKGEADGSRDRLQLIVVGDDRLRSRVLP